MFKILFIIFLFTPLLSRAYDDIFYHVNNRIYQENHPSKHTIIHEPQDVVRLYKDQPGQLLHPNPFKPQIFLSAGIGAHYIYTPNYSYTNAGTESEIVNESYSHTMLPIGLEASFPTKTRLTISLGGNYYFNPINNSYNLNTNGTRIFTAETKYMIYGKVEYKTNNILSLYALAGVSGIDLQVYNDITNELFLESTVNAPSGGIGFNLNINDNFKLFIDGIYSYMSNTGANYNGTNARLNAIAQKRYYSFQGRAGIAFDLTSLVE